MNTCNVDYTEVEVRYIGETPVECVRVHMADGTVVTFRPTREQMSVLSDQLRSWVATR